MSTALRIDGRNPGGEAAGLPALVAVVDPLLRSEVDAALAAGGLRPVPFPGRGEAECGREPAALAVVCEQTVASLAPAQAARLRAAGSDSPLPLLLVTTGALPPVDDMVRRGITDFVLADRVGEDLGYRAALIQAETLFARRRRASAGTLRERARRISAAVRATNDPDAMAEVVVQGLVHAFEADHAVLLTFPDERVPQLSLAFSREHAAGTAPLLSGTAVEDFARRLWADGRVASVEDHLRPAEEPEPLQEAALAAGVRASVFLPLGHGEASFGMLWLAASAGPRTFTSTELSLMHHVCGNLAHGLVQGHLITAQRKVMARLRELDQAKTTFVATVNHELRTPLTSITGYLDLILDGSGTELPADVQQMLAIVGRNANRLNQLISDLLTLSRSDARESALAVEEIDLARLLSEVGDSLAPTADAGGVTVHVDCAVHPLLVDGDCDQLEQVFTNLLSNAVKFTPAGGSVRVSAGTAPSELSGPMVRVSVTDTGIGIPADDLPKLFQRFFRASNATSAAIPGTGLGLAIVQDIVHQHGGELQVSSEVGRGTTFTVQLPARA